MTDPHSVWRPWLGWLRVSIAVLLGLAGRVAAQEQQDISLAAGYTAVGVPFAGTDTAAALLDWAGTAATGVWRYDAPTQAWVGYQRGDAGNGFAVVPGMAVVIECGTAGVVSRSGAWAPGIQHDLAPGRNLICVPAEQPAQQDAASLLAAIPFAQGVWSWAADEQRWRGYTAVYGGENFTVARGDAVVVAMSQAVIWPVVEAAPVNYLVIDVSPGPDATSYPVTTLDRLPDPIPDEFRTTKIALKRIPYGTFIMGSPTDELGRNPDGRETEHEVTLTEDFYMSVFEITQKQYERIMGTWPGYFTNTDSRDVRPVDSLVWDSIRGEQWVNYINLPLAGSFIDRLRQRSGVTVDLPTEARWEYACRAGTGTALNSGLNLTATDDCPNLAALGRYQGNGGSPFAADSDLDSGSTRVGSYAPNAWGLYDMHGNVYEYCLDWYQTSLPPASNPVGPFSGNLRVIRGGSWVDLAGACRSAARVGTMPGSTNRYAGLRLVAPGGEVDARRVTFDLGEHGTRTGGGDLLQFVAPGGAAVAPEFTVAPGWSFTGWSAPFDQVTADLNVVAQYAVAATGSLKVMILPVTAVAAGAEWRVDGGAWLANGATVRDLALGDHEVTFKDVTNWTTPAPLTVTLTVAGQTLETTATYEGGMPPDTYLIVDVSAGSMATDYPVTLLAALPEPIPDEYRTTKIALRRIPAGVFIMGSPGGELGRNSDGRETEHQVTLTEDFYMGVFEVTQRQFELVTGTNPSTYRGDTRPVDYVSWDSIRGGNWPLSNRLPAVGTFVELLRVKTGVDFDLPTEARWEYACRAGTGPATWNNGTTITVLSDCPNLDPLARYRYNGGSADGGQHAPVGSYLPNAWGLYDMHGNVSEWCLDWWDGTEQIPLTNPEGPPTGTYRDYRGGAWNDDAQYCRAAWRGASVTTYRYNGLGFRLVSPPASPTPQYTVTFDLGEHGTRTGGGELTQTVYHGNAAVPPEFTVASGWMFTGWSEPFNYVTTDLTVVAQYAAGGPVTVTFDLGEHGTHTGGGALVQTIAAGAGAMAPEVTAAAGWTFTGWSAPFDHVTTDLTVVAQYAADNVGSLTVTIEPPAAVLAGGKWRVDGGAWQESGATVGGLALADHEVTFAVVAGWVAPASRTAALTVGGQALEWTATYAAQPAQHDYLVIDISGGAAATSYPVTTLDTLPHPVPDEYRTTKIVLRRILAGTFTMGSPATEVARADTENQHAVTLTQDVYVGVFEITQKQWELAMGSNPSYYQGEHRPVESVSWGDVRGGDWPSGSRVPAAASFIGTLRARTRLAFDLPTEAQWEYSCRSGTTTAWNNGTDITASGACPNLDPLGRYKGNAGESQHVAVGSYLPNARGLYDMHGNVWEWCLDYWNGNAYSVLDAVDPEGDASGLYRVQRGGSWYTLASYCRSANRYRYGPDGRNTFGGFRLCLPAGPPATHTVDFDLGDHGTRTGGGELVQTIAVGAGAVAPEVTAAAGWVFIGWSVPFNNVTADLTVVAQYAAIGSVTVTLGPALAIAAGARWSIADSGWQESGATVGDLSLGNYEVWFQTIDGWLSPTPLFLDLTEAGQSLAFTATYTPAPVVSYLVVDIAAGPNATSYPVTTITELPNPIPNEYRTTKIVLRQVPAGTFTMGSPSDELGRRSDEVPHQVTLTEDFYIGVFEITQKQWERVMGTWPSYFTNVAVRDMRPVEKVSWDASRGGEWPARDRQPAPGTFVGRLRARTGVAFDLPTEARWEYACRAGTTTALNSGLNLTALGECPNVAAVARYWYNSGAVLGATGGLDEGTFTVGGYAPNAWGLYDMHGNVREWCLDGEGTYPTGAVIDPAGPVSADVNEWGEERITRGGHWGADARFCRSAYRYREYANWSGSPDAGLRIVAPVPTP